MKSYKVYVPFIVRVCVEVEAESEESAIEQAYDEAYLATYVGNGGYDKLCGVSDPHMCLEVGEQAVDWYVGNLDPIVEED